MIDQKCKNCRRVGIKLFTRGEKCTGPKCPLVRRPYAPGQRSKRRKSALSEYGKELREKQNLKNWYNLAERQFRKYVKEVLGYRGKVADAGDLLVERLETRLDNVVFRSGFASSRPQARQLVSHCHFLLNGKPTNMPSQRVKKNDLLTLRESSKKKTIFQNLSSILKKHKPPSWILIDGEKLEAKIIGKPTLLEAAPPVEVSAIFEFYSR